MHSGRCDYGLDLLPAIDACRHAGRRTPASRRAAGHQRRGRTVAGRYRFRDLVLAQSRWTSLRRRGAGRGSFYGRRSDALWYTLRSSPPRSVQLSRAEWPIPARRDGLSIGFSVRIVCAASLRELRRQVQELGPPVLLGWPTSFQTWVVDSLLRPWSCSCDVVETIETLGSRTRATRRALALSGGAWENG